MQYHQLIIDYQGAPVALEMDVAKATFDDAVAQVWAGDYAPKLLKVVAIDIVAGTARDVTLDVAGAIEARSHADGEPVTDEVERFLGENGCRGYRRRDDPEFEGTTLFRNRPEVRDAYDDREAA